MDLRRGPPYGEAVRQCVCDAYGAGNFTACKMTKIITFPVTKLIKLGFLKTFDGDKAGGTVKLDLLTPPIGWTSGEVHPRGEPRVYLWLPRLRWGGECACSSASPVVLTNRTFGEKTSALQDTHRETGSCNAYCFAAIAFACLGELRR